MERLNLSELIEKSSLSGFSIAEIRAQYQEEFGLSENSTAILNSKKVAREKEADVVLCDEDELVFGEKNHRKMVMLGTLALALLLTVGAFAATFTVRSQTISISAASSDFAAVTTNATPASVTLLGSHTGTLGAATLFDIAGNANYTGDLSVIVSLVNADEMIQDYSFWQMRLEYVDSSNTTSDLEGFTKLIGLTNPSTTFTVDSANVSGGTFYLRTPGTIYRTLPFVLGSAGADPQIFIEVLQAGAQ